MIKNIFDKSINTEVIERINYLTADTKQKWGTMNVGQMLAHCNVTYEMAFDESNEPKPTGLKKWILKTFIKSVVVSEKTYKKNGRTAPAFVKTDSFEFEKEKTRLINYLNKTQSLGRDHFKGKESHSFGVLTEKEWNNSFYKHLDHHLNQFGV